ncbi:hypothetical protein WJX72_000651 [[Myrmecia] bisecta]|uniref:Uncharacterized protein n=1 Tax=[Myrmecia] bisecta TaxID=41462 RepID=A0AAW1Q2C8_9CHLO
MFKTPGWGRVTDLSAISTSKTTAVYQLEPSEEGLAEQQRSDLSFRLPGSGTAFPHLLPALSLELVLLH